MGWCCIGFQSTRLSRASTARKDGEYIYLLISIHKALASLDEDIPPAGRGREISIHKALASLDPDKIMYNTSTEISIHKALASLDEEI